MSYEVLQLALFTNDIERVRPIEKIVSPLGWQLIAAVMQKQPIQWILEQKIELILVDLDIPNSIQLTSSLIRCRPTVPILAITSESSIDKIHDAIEMGAKDFITYPINTKRLMAALHSAIGERSTTVSNIIPFFDESPSVAAPQNGQLKSVKVATAAPVHRKAVEAIDELAGQFVSEDTGFEDAESEVVKTKVFETETAELEDAKAGIPVAESTLEDSLGTDLAVTLDASDELVYENHQANRAQPLQSNSIQTRSAEPAPVQPDRQPRKAADKQASESSIHSTQGTASSSFDETSSEVMNTNHRMRPIEDAAIEGAIVEEAIVEEAIAEQAIAEQAVAEQAVEVRRPNGQQHPNGTTASANTSVMNTPPAQFQPANGLTTSTTAVHGKITAVVSLRGGIGRSTIATNLAVATAQKEYGNVTLIEAHHGLSNLSLMLHLHPQRTLATLENEHTIDHDIVRGYLQQHTSGVNILSAPTEIDDMIELAPETWSHLIETTAGLAHHTILDTSSAADSALTEVLMKADEILVVTDPDIASLRSATALYKNIYTEPSISGQMRLVINRSGVSGGLDEKTIQNQIGHEAVVSLPYDPALTTYAMNRGIPFVQSHPRALLTKRIQELADKLFKSESMLAQQDATKKPASKSSFMSFLGRS